MQRTNAFYNPKLWSPALRATPNSTFVRWHKLEIQLRHDICPSALIITLQTKIPEGVSISWYFPRAPV